MNNFKSLTLKIREAAEFILSSFPLSSHLQKEIYEKNNVAHTALKLLNLFSLDKY